MNGLTSCQCSILSQRLRRMQRDKAPPQITNSILPKVSDWLPAPAEQADNLILWVGDHQPSSAQHIEICDLEVSAWIGTEISPNSDAGLAWLLRQKEVKRLVENNASQSGPNRLLLTVEGWQRYEELKHKLVESRKAFIMAMKFGDSELDVY
jgi:hypothetical protein